MIGLRGSSTSAKGTIALETRCERNGMSAPGLAFDRRTWTTDFAMCKTGQKIALLKQSINQASAWPYGS